MLTDALKTVLSITKNRGKIQMLAEILKKTDHLSIQNKI